MVEALRNLVDLYSFYFETLGGAFDGLLELLQVCICQGEQCRSMNRIILTLIAENDTIARIGTSCLQKLLEKNVQKFSHPQWERLTSAFVSLFKMTTPHQLFDENLRIEIPSSIGVAPDIDGSSFTRMTYNGSYALR
jgi:brefeldin A-inhibited guanine nucleotide-exchange protein